MEEKKQAIVMEKISFMENDTTEYESGDDKFNTSENYDDIYEGEQDEDEDQDEKDDPHEEGGSGDETKEAKQKEDVTDPHVAPEDETSNIEAENLLDIENQKKFKFLMEGEYSLQEDEITALFFALKEIQDYAEELALIEKKTTGTVFNKPLKKYLEKFIAKKEEEIMDILLPDILNDDNDAVGGERRDLLSVYEDIKLLELVQNENEIILGKEHSQEGIPFSVEDMKKKLISSDTMLAPIYALIYSIIDTHSDKKLLDIFIEATKENTTTKLYSEDILSVFSFS